MSGRRLAPFAATAAAVTLLLFLRRPDAFSNPQFWAEDGNRSDDAVRSIGKVAG